MPPSKFPPATAATLPSIPSLRGGLGRRGDLLAALSFVDDPPRSARSLARWLDTHLVSKGRMPRPRSASEAFYSPVPLDMAWPEPDRISEPPEEPDDAEQLVVVARARVLHALRGFMPPACDERFLAAAIASGRVRSDGGDSIWEAFPGESDLLSDIVLSLFASDILTHREFHDAYLCVCKTCFRIHFDPRESGRTGCPDHQPTGALDAVPRSRVPG